MENKVIKSFNISLKNLHTAAGNRSFTVKGDDGAKFMIQVVRNDGRWYHWPNREFRNAIFGVGKNLKGTISGGVYNGNIRFPAGSSRTYTILLMPEPNTNTIIQGGRVAFNKTITQSANTTVTFRIKSLSNASTYNSFPSDITSSGSPAGIYDTRVQLSDWTVSNIENDSNGFGLRLIRQPKNTDWLFRQTQTVDGATSGITTVVLDSVENLVEGMKIVLVSSGSLSGKPSITKIDTDTKTVTLSSAQTFADGITLTFDAFGMEMINRAVGLDVEWVSTGATAAELTKTARATSSSTTVNLNGAYGIAGNNVVSVDGVNWNNNHHSHDNKVVSVSASSSAGSMVVDVAQTLAAGTKLYFKGSTKEVTLTGYLKIKKYPDADRTILLDVDGFIRPGFAS